ncbi:MAG: 2-oxoacid:acceptor oxidoreductase family protein [Candidatus Bathyarchaeia archaeon]
MLVEFRLHGRGGQGVVIGAELLAKAAFIEGRWSQASPFFGAERRGAPVKAYTRISDREIYIRSQVYEPDCVIVFDHTLLGDEVWSGLKPSGMAVINTGRTPENLGLRFRVATVDATSIALRLGLLTAGLPMVNTAMLGALARAYGVVSIDSVLKAIVEEWPRRAGEVNVAAAKAAYESTLTG